MRKKVLGDGFVGAANKVLVRYNSMPSAGGLTKSLTNKFSHLFVTLENIILYSDLKFPIEADRLLEFLSSGDVTTQLTTASREYAAFFEEQILISEAEFVKILKKNNVNETISQQIIKAFTKEGFLLKSDDNYIFSEKFLSLFRDRNVLPQAESSDANFMFKHLCSVFKEKMIGKYMSFRLNFISESWLRKESINEIFWMEWEMCERMHYDSLFSETYFPIYLLINYYAQNRERIDSAGKFEKFIRLLENCIIDRGICKETAYFIDTVLMYQSLRNQLSNSGLSQYLLNPENFSKLIKQPKEFPKFTLILTYILPQVIVLTDPNIRQTILEMIERALMQLIQKYDAFDIILDEIAYIVAHLLLLTLNPRSLFVPSQIETVSEKNLSLLLNQLFWKLWPEKKQNNISMNDIALSDAYISLCNDSKKYNKTISEWLATNMKNPFKERPTKNYYVMFGTNEYCKTYIAVYELIKLRKFLIEMRENPSISGQKVIEAIRTLYKDSNPKSPYSFLRQVNYMGIIPQIKATEQSIQTFPGFYLNAFINAFPDVKCQELAEVIESFFRLSVTLGSEEKKTEIETVISEYLQVFLDKRVLKDEDLFLFAWLLRSIHTPSKVKNTLKNKLHALFPNSFYLSFLNARSHNNLRSNINQLKALMNKTSPSELEWKFLLSRFPNKKEKEILASLQRVKKRIQLLINRADKKMESKSPAQEGSPGGIGSITDPEEAKLLTAVKELFQSLKKVLPFNSGLGNITIINIALKGLKELICSYEEALTAIVLLRCQKIGIDKIVEKHGVQALGDQFSNWDTLDAKEAEISRWLLQAQAEQKKIVDYKSQRERVESFFRQYEMNKKFEKNGTLKLTPTYKTQDTFKKIKEVGDHLNALKEEQKGIEKYLVDVGREEEALRNFIGFVSSLENTEWLFDDIALTSLFTPGEKCTRDSILKQLNQRERVLSEYIAEMLQYKEDILSAINTFTEENKVLDRQYTAEIDALFQAESPEEKIRKIENALPAPTTPIKEPLPDLLALLEQLLSTPESQQISYPLPEHDPLAHLIKGLFDLQQIGDKIRFKIRLYDCPDFQLSLSPDGKLQFENLSKDAQFHFPALYSSIFRLVQDLLDKELISKEDRYSSSPDRVFFSNKIPPNLLRAIAFTFVYSRTRYKEGFEFLTKNGEGMRITNKSKANLEAVLKLMKETVYYSKKMDSSKSVSILTPLTTEEALEHLNSGASKVYRFIYHPMALRKVKSPVNPDMVSRYIYYLALSRLKDGEDPDTMATKLKETLLASEVLDDGTLKEDRRLGVEVKNGRNTLALMTQQIEAYNEADRALIDSLTQRITPISPFLTLVEVIPPGKSLAINP